MILESDPGRAKAASAEWSNYVLDQSFSMPVAANYGRVATQASVNGVAFNGAGDWIVPNDAWFSA